MTDTAVITDVGYIVPCPDCGASTGGKFVTWGGRTWLKVGRVLMKTGICPVCGAELFYLPTPMTPEEMIARSRARWETIRARFDRLEAQVAAGDVAGIEADIEQDR